MDSKYHTSPLKKSNKSHSIRWTRTEIILMILSLGLLIYILYPYFLDVSNQVDAACRDPSCYESVLEIENFIDRNVSPCEDFSQFACGNFFKNAYKKQMTSVVLEERRELENELNEMIVGEISPEDSPPVKLQKFFYQTCTNTLKIDADQNREILSLVEEIGGWPMLFKQSWQPDQFNWLTLLVKCKSLGLPFQWFLEFGIHWDGKNYFKISYPTFKTSSKPATKIANHMEEILSNLLGVKAKVQDIHKFEQQFARMLIKQRSEITITKISDLQKTLPILNWLSFLNDITNGSYVFEEDSEVASNIEEYLPKLFQLLGETDKRIQANYVVWKIIQFFSPYMALNVRQHTDQSLSRSQLCVEKTKETFPYITQIEYIRKYQTEKLKKSVENLVDAIKSEFLERIEKSTWLNTTAGQTYFDQFSKTAIEIGAPEEIFDDDFVELNYLNLGNQTYESETPNIIQILTKRSKFYHSAIFSNINETGIDPEEKQVLSKTTRLDPSFHRYLDRLIVPLPVLRGTLYHQKRPNFLNFGSLGSIVAKGFIDGIRDLTEDEGNVTNIAFQTSNRCFENDLDSYSNFAKEGFDSSDVILRVVSDVIARDIAYSAYQKVVESSGESLTHPLLEYYSPNQLFWIKSSLIDCYQNLPDMSDIPDILPKISPVPRIPL